MPLGKSIIIAVFLYVNFLIPTYSHQKEPLGNWLEFCPNSQLCFERPLSLMPVDVQIIDSIAGQLDDEHLTLFYDLGRYASTFPEFSTASSEVVKIDHHEGKMFIEQNKMALTVANIFGKTSFSMLIEFKDSLDVEQGRRIFNSVKFKLIK